MLGARADGAGVVITGGVILFAGEAAASEWRSAPSEPTALDCSE